MQNYSYKPIRRRIEMSTEINKYIEDATKAAARWSPKFSIGLVSFNYLLSRVSILTRWYSKSVCPSVRNVPVSDENGLTYGHSFFFTVR